MNWLWVNLSFSWSGWSCTVFGETSCCGFIDGRYLALHQCVL